MSRFEVANLNLMHNLAYVARDDDIAVDSSSYFIDIC